MKKKKRKEPQDCGTVLMYFPKKMGGVEAMARVNALLLENLVGVLLVNQERIYNNHVYEEFERVYTGNSGGRDCCIMQG